MEAQPEWAAAEEQPAAEAQPEWSAPAEGQTEWAAAEEQPVMEAQPEWSAPAEGQTEWVAAEEQPVMEAQPEWAAAEEQPVMEAQPEWSAPVEAQPVAETQPEWAASEDTATVGEQTGWAAPAEPQPEWSPEGATQDWNAPAAGQTEWNAPVEEVQTEWTTSEPEQPQAETWGGGEPQAQGEWASAPAETAWNAPAQEHWSDPQPQSAWGQSADAYSTPVEDVSVTEEPLPAAEPELPVMEVEPEPELPVMEAEPEMPEIDLSEDIVEPPPVAVPVSRPAAVAMPPPPPMTAPANAVLVPGAPPPRATLSMPALSSVSAQPASAPVMAPVNAFIEGEHRVIIHTVEGQVKRGAIRDVDLLDESIPLEQQTGFAPERIPIKRIKAIFFMLATGSRPPQPDGQKIRITFIDGRQVAGFSHDYKGTGEGFFVIPADTRTNTSRIFIYRASVQAVAEG
jgi:hypothetical protein